ncbi:hypothetical protein DFS34DRAFT_676270 [Phlyctochytrium arcticum]|nr:hypothetical protein DFS34DRAFT_676270 [Phlyctochytrium arcticum]
MDEGDDDAYHRLVYMDDYITSEMEQPWTDADVSRVRDKLVSNFPRDAEKFYECVLGKLENRNTPMFARLNLLLILDKLCTESIQDPDSAFHVVLGAMRRDVVKVVGLVLDVGMGAGNEGEGPTRAANANVSWVRKLLMTWRRRNLLSDQLITDCEKIIDAAEQIEELGPEDSIRYDDEKIDRRMDADRERQKKGREDTLLQNALRPWDDVSDSGYIEEGDDGALLDANEFWDTAPDSLTESDFERLEIENEKFRVKSCMFAQYANNNGKGINGGFSCLGHGMYLFQHGGFVPLCIYP